MTIVSRPSLAVQATLVPTHPTNRSSYPFSQEQKSNSLLLRHGGLYDTLNLGHCQQLSDASRDKPHTNGAMPHPHQHTTTQNTGSGRDRLALAIDSRFGDTQPTTPQSLSIYDVVSSEDITWTSRFWCHLNLHLGCRAAFTV